MAIAFGAWCFWLLSGPDQCNIWTSHIAAITSILFLIIQILTAHEGNGGKLLSRGETQPWPTIH